MHHCKPAQRDRSLLAGCRILRQILEPRSPGIALRQVDRGLQALCVRIPGAVYERFTLPGFDEKIGAAILRRVELVIPGVTHQAPGCQYLAQGALLIHIYPACQKHLPSVAGERETILTPANLMKNVSG